MMTTQETAFAEIERLVKSFKDMPKENSVIVVDTIQETVEEFDYDYSG